MLSDDRALLAMWRVRSSWTLLRRFRGPGVLAYARPSPCFFLSLADLPSVGCIVAESKRLDSEEQDAEEAFRVERLALAEAQKRLDESLACLDRIRR
jgi:hypothetical protein